MKYLVVLACLVVVTYAVAPEVVEKLKQKLVAKAGECKTEVGTSDDDVAPLKAHTPPTTQKGKCFLACVYKKFGGFDASGKIDKSGAMATIEKVKALDEDLYGKMKKVSEVCMGEVTDAADECETALNMYICSCREAKAVGIPPLDF